MVRQEVARPLFKITSIFSIIKCLAAIFKELWFLRVLPFGTRVGPESKSQDPFCLLYKKQKRASYQLPGPGIFHLSFVLSNLKYWQHPLKCHETYSCAVPAFQYCIANGGGRDAAHPPTLLSPQVTKIFLGRQEMCPALIAQRTCLLHRACGSAHNLSKP